MQLTPNEASLIGAFGGAALGAVVGAGVSFLVARYTLHHGPNYQSQIQGINDALGSLAKTQEAFRQQHENFEQIERREREEERIRAEAALWKPKVKITSAVEGNEQVNKLILQASQEFCLNEVALISASGTKLHEYRVDGSKLFSTGFSVQITHASLILIANSSASYFQNNTFEGKLRYSGERRDGTAFEGELPFRAVTVTVQNTLWFKLTG